MSTDPLVDHLAEFATLSSIPRPELEWLVAHGKRTVFEVGETLARRGDRMDWMYILLAGNITIYRDVGTGPHLIMVWRPGDVTGLLPYSRAGINTYNDVVIVERTEVIAIHAEQFPEMVHRCPALTTYLVHTMLDRARRFNSADLQEERALSLGKLAAGLAHELNNPASATVRAAKLLSTSLHDADVAVDGLSGKALTPTELAAIARARDACAAGSASAQRAPIQQAKHEEQLAAWLGRHGANPAHAAQLAETSVDTRALDELASCLSADHLEAALAWIAARCAIHSLAADVGRASTQIYQLVNVLKRFTHMDRLSGPEIADVEQGLRDTLTMIDAKRHAKDAVISLEVAPELPRVRASGADLNQVWLNLIDNALDAIPPSGHVLVSAHRELNRVVVRVVDDGTGIPAEILPRIFEPFFTTKALGQGMGLGLEIARQLLKRHQGDVTVTSRPGRTEFLVSLQAQPAGQVAEVR